MRCYMPGRHMNYLTALAADSRSLRHLVQQTPELYALYDSTVMALKPLRDVHIRVVLTCK
ncbi:hypothetical protein B0H13DRAFT_2089373 [Mycena leptocephala]|nr:hypothetical protein B0H13DRAFT_2089373 [Mycena leptocephala]